MTRLRLLLNDSVLYFQYHSVRVLQFHPVSIILSVRCTSILPRQYNSVSVIYFRITLSVSLSEYCTSILPFQYPSVSSLYFTCTLSVFFCQCLVLILSSDTDVTFSQQLTESLKSAFMFFPTNFGRVLHCYKHIHFSTS
jgi:hypothetical protein